MSLPIERHHRTGQYVKYTAESIVWIQTTNESDADRKLQRELHAYTMDNELFPAIRAGGGGPKGESHGYSPEDAHKILEWLKERGATPTSEPESVRVDIMADHIYIGDEKGEIVYWDRQEWLDDPDIIVPISNAIRIAYLEGGDALRNKIR